MTSNFNAPSFLFFFPGNLDRWEAREGVGIIAAPIWRAYAGGGRAGAGCAAAGSLNVGRRLGSSGGVDFVADDSADKRTRREW